MVTSGVGAALFEEKLKLKFDAWHSSGSVLINSVIVQVGKCLL